VRTRMFVLILTLSLAAALGYGCGSKFITGARVHIKQGEYSEAIPLLEKEIDVNPGNVEAYILLGESFCELDDFDSGGEAFNAAEALIAADPQGEYKEALNQTRMFYWSKAFEAGRIPFNEAIGLLDDGKEEEATLKFREAVDKYKACDKIYEAHPKNEFMLGFSYEKLEAANPGPTISDFNRIEAGMSYQEVTGILRGPGELVAESESGGRKYEDYKWDSGGYGICKVTFINGKVDTKVQTNLEDPIGKAFAAYEKAVLVKKKDMATNNFDEQTSLSDYVIKYANAALKTENYEEARKTLADLAAEEPDNTELLYAYAVLLLNMDEYDEAAETLKHIIEIDPDYDDAVISMGNLYIKEEWSGRDPRKTIELLEPLLDTDEHKDDFQLYASLGKAYQALGDNKKAAMYYSKAQELYNERTGGE
jgi:tetratricopeptide (TPR) repeat protein